VNKPFDGNTAAVRPVSDEVFFETSNPPQANPRVSPAEPCLANPNRAFRQGLSRWIQRRVESGAQFRHRRSPPNDVMVDEVAPSGGPLDCAGHRSRRFSLADELQGLALHRVEIVLRDIHVVPALFALIKKSVQPASKVLIDRKGLATAYAI
jgi:hypothetical protein